ncbi:MAG: hypothetical protein S4CHLAM45_01050 [Chlamydiales bacterium]|nr:hypothetical protein [Chlamydiales bacterium]MCH9619426.1 hypothetical protein [Chlamydiales bacterium]MCH9622230.1 hypothetical protein [Chlamydiales bacterium]
MNTYIYSKKLIEKIENPRSFGTFSKREGMRTVTGKAGKLDEGNHLQLHLLVDELDGAIVDARFQLFGGPPLIAAAEVGCDLLVGKNYDQAKRIGADLIDMQLRDHPDNPAFPEEAWAQLNLVIDAIDDSVEQCLDIPLASNYASPVPATEGEAYPGWEELTDEQKVTVLEEVIEKEIRPYIELDAGGIEIVELTGDELTIAYQGSCTSCFSAVGATLSSIQQIIQSKVHPELKVTPDMSALKF